MRRVSLRAALVLACALAAAAAPPWLPVRVSPASNTVTLPAGSVPALKTTWSSRAAAAVRALGDALTPRWLNATQNRLAHAGITFRHTERILVTPALRIFIASASTPLPISIKEVASWARAPETYVARNVFLPLQVWFRTQYYLADDYAVGLARPGTTVPVVTGAGARGLRRRLLQSRGDTAALRAQLLARIVAEAPACLAEYTLDSNAAVAPPSNGSDAADLMAPLHALDVTLTSMRLLAQLHGGNVTADWGQLAALTLEAQAGVFAAQLLSARVGVNALAINLPAAEASGFTRFGLETDVGVDTTLRLVPAAGHRRQLQAAPAPDSNAAESSPLLDDGALLALSLPAGVLLPPDVSSAAVALLEFMRQQAGAAGEELAQLLAQLLAQKPLTVRADFLVTPLISFVLGQVAFSVPTDAMSLAAALEEPTLSPLLRTTVDFTASVSIAFSVIFTASPPALVRPLGSVGRRRLLQAEPTQAPDVLLAKWRAFLAVAGGSVRVQELLASFQFLTFDSANAQVYSGVLLRETLRKSAVLNKTALLAHEPPLFSAQAAAVVGGTGFKFFTATVSANTGITAKLIKRGGT